MNIRWFASQEAIAVLAEAHCPGALDALTRAREVVTTSKRAISGYQAAALYAIARAYNKPGARILEIGTAYGFSASVLALAAPDAHLTTLNPKAAEYPHAVDNLSGFPNVDVVQMRSDDYLRTLDVSDRYDLVFVDGDHEHVAADLPYWDHVRVGGLMLFHDYSPGDSWRPCPPVHEVVDRMARALEREPDVLVVDSGGVGMAGFVPRLSDLTWYELSIPVDFAPWHVEYDEGHGCWVREGEYA